MIGWRTVVARQEQDWWCGECAAKNGGFYGGLPHQKVGSNELLCWRCYRNRTRSVLKNWIIGIEMGILLAMGVIVDHRLIDHLVVVAACLIGAVYLLGGIATVIEEIREGKKKPNGTS